MNNNNNNNNNNNDTNYINKKVTVCIFWGENTVQCGRDEIFNLLKKYYKVKQWTTFNFLDTKVKIKSGDILLFPGGSASGCFEDLCSVNEMNCLDVEEKIKSYISKGIHYIGVCAGSYLARTQLKLFVYNGSSNGMGNIGKVDLKIEKKFMVSDGNKSITYHQGPLFFNELPNDFKTIATFKKIPSSGFNGVNKNKYIGSPAIIYRQSADAQGGILLFSPHFEYNNQKNGAHKQFIKIISKTLLKTLKPKLSYDDRRVNYLPIQIKQQTPNDVIKVLNSITLVQNIIIVVNFGSTHLSKILAAIKMLKSDLIVMTVNWNALDTILKTNLTANLIGIILSGSPKHLYDQDSPKISNKIFELNVPILGICYGMQMITHLYGATIKKMLQKESGDYSIKILESSNLFRGLDENITVKMRHNDQVTELPQCFKVIAKTNNCIAAAEYINNNAKIYCVQFHPELDLDELCDSPGYTILQNFLNICY